MHNTSILLLTHLIEGSWEAIDQHRVGLGSVDRALQNLHHQFGGHDFAIFHVAVDEVSCSALRSDFIAQEVAR